jgi:hypothetical protein
MTGGLAVTGGPAVTGGLAVTAGPAVTGWYQPTVAFWTAEAPRVGLFPTGPGFYLGVPPIADIQTAPLPQPQGDAAGMRVQPLGLGQRHAGGTDLRQRVGVRLHPGGALEEVEH